MESEPPSGSRTQSEQAQVQVQDPTSPPQPPLHSSPPQKQASSQQQQSSPIPVPSSSPSTPAHEDVQMAIASLKTSNGDLTMSSMPPLEPLQPMESIPMSMTTSMPMQLHMGQVQSPMSGMSLSASLSHPMDQTPDGTEGGLDVRMGMDGMRVEEMGSGALDGDIHSVPMGDISDQQRQQQQHITNSNPVLSASATPLPLSPELHSPAQNQNQNLHQQSSPNSASLSSSPRQPTQTQSQSLHLGLNLNLSHNQNEMMADALAHPHNQRVLPHSHSHALQHGHPHGLPPLHTVLSQPGSTTTSPPPPPSSSIASPLSAPASMTMPVNIPMSAFRFPSPRMGINSLQTGVGVGEQGMTGGMTVGSSAQSQAQVQVQNHMSPDRNHTFMNMQSPPSSAPPQSQPQSPSSSAVAVAVAAAQAQAHAQQQQQHLSNMNGMSVSAFNHHVSSSMMGVADAVVSGSGGLGGTGGSGNSMHNGTGISAAGANTANTPVVDGLETLPSGYVTPQSSGFLDFPQSISGGSPLASEDRNYMILDLAHRLQQSAIFLTQAVHEGREIEVEQQLATVDHIHALFQPFRRGAPCYETVSPPSSTASMPPPPVPSHPHSTSTRNNKSPSEDLLQQQPQQQAPFASRPPSPMGSGAGGIRKGHMSALSLDSGDAGRKRCASAVTDGDRIIKSLKLEAVEDSSAMILQSSSHSLPHPQSHMHQQQGLSPLQLGSHTTSSSMIAPPPFMTPLTPSTDSFFSHPSLTHPMTPLSSHSHTLFGMPSSSNPPSEPASRPPSPSVRRQLPMLQASHPQASLGGALASVHHSFSMDHTGHPTNNLSWPDLSSVTSVQQPISSNALTQALNLPPFVAPQPPPSAVNASASGTSVTPFASPTKSSFASHHASATTTPARVRPSRSSSYSSAVHAANGSSNAFGPTPVEDYEKETFQYYPNSTSFSISAPHSPHSTSSDESLDWAHHTPSTPSHPHHISIDSDLYAHVNHIPNPDHPGSEIPVEFKHEVERIFFEFLNRICSNLEATDSKGEPIHQTLMAKKMQRLDESPDFRPFKFRIQAFTTAFLEELARQGYPEDKIPMKKIRGYLWIQPFISRYNEDGKKSKSKGNHIWNVDAKKNPEGGWIFRKFQRKIAGNPPSVAYEGLKWSFMPHIYDPQQSRRNETVKFSSPWLPFWMRWDKDTLVGIPPDDAQSTDITIEARFTENNQPVLLTHTFHLVVAPLNAGDVNSLNPMIMHSRPTVSGDNGLTRRVNSDSLIPQMTGILLRPQLPRQPTKLSIPPPTGSSRVVQVLNDTVERILQAQAIASVSYADPQMHASLACQHQVITAAIAAIEASTAPLDSIDIQTSAIANVATQFVASTVDMLVQERRPMHGFSLNEPSITVKDVSAVTHTALTQAVNSLSHSSNEVEVFMAAKAFVQASRGRFSDHPLMMDAEFGAPPSSALSDMSFPPSGSLTSLPPPPS